MLPTKLRLYSVFTKVLCKLRMQLSHHDRHQARFRVFVRAVFLRSLSADFFGKDDAASELRVLCPGSRRGMVMGSVHLVSMSDVIRLLPA